MDEQTNDFEKNGLVDKIKRILQPRFVHFDAFAEALGLALSAERNIWFFGDGGYGKSDMVETVFTGLGIMEKTFVQAFGQGMTPEKLVGNLDMKMLNNKGLFRYNVNESFLVKKYAIFEEMADAAVPVLFLLKDTLQRGKFRDGTQQVDIATKTIVVNSNRSPSSVAEYGADAAALVQRWPIEVNVIWPSHKANDYVMLINKQQPHIQGPNLDSSSRDHLAQMLADTSAKGEPIPPRIALDAVRAIKTMAIIRGRDGIHGSDFNALRYVRGLQAVGAVAEKTMKDSEMRSLAVKAFETKKQECFDLQKEYIDCKTPIPCIQISKRAEKLIGEVNGLIITDNLENGKKNLIADLIELKNQAVTTAVGFVKI